MKSYEYEHVRIEDRVGTWYEIEREYVNNELYLLLEHEEYGSDVEWLLVKVPPTQKMLIEEIKGKNRVVFPKNCEIGETWDGLIPALEDYGIQYEDEKYDELKEEVEQLRIITRRIEEIANKIQ